MNGPCVRAQLAADHVEGGRLAGAVGTDDGDQLALVDGEAHIVGGDDAAERLRQSAGLQQGHAGRPRSRAYSSEAWPARPCGNSSTSRMMTAPRMARQKSVSGMTASLTRCSTAAPNTGPVTVWMPPSSTIASASTEVGIDSTPGSMLPLENT